MAVVRTERPYDLEHVINHVYDVNSPAEHPLLFATRNQNKLRELSDALGMPIEGIDLKVKEIQSEDPEEVLREKAIQAWIESDGEAVFVEDSSLSCPGIDGLPGPFIDQFTNTRAKKDALCRAVGDDRRAVFRVGIGVFDGEDVHMRFETVDGEIADTPRGTRGFGFDDIFIPVNQTDAEGNILPRDQWKTYAQMDDEEKMRYSPRRKIAEGLREEPIAFDTHVYALPKPEELLLKSIDRERLGDERALAFAYDLEAIKGSTPNPDLTVDLRRPFYEIALGDGEIKQYVTDPESASGGIIITPWDTARDFKGRPTRLRVDRVGNVRFKQMSDEGIAMALAARDVAFQSIHNEKTYEELRERLKGRKRTPKRSNRRSPVIEELLTATGDVKDLDVLGTAAIQELGYARQYSDMEMSRNDPTNTALIVDTSGIPTNLFSLGGMPPVSGSVDVIKTAALTLHEVHIPRNGVFVDVNRRVRLFQEAVEGIGKLDLPYDIHQLVVDQIGMSVGCQNIEQVLKEIELFYKAGGRSIRFYTTAADRKVPLAAEAARQKFGESLRITVAPMVDIEQAYQLVDPDIRVNKIVAGHGGGENCTSLKGGGTANALELAYRMSIDKDFNDTAIGLEGGTGNAIGALLGFVDNISLNRRGVAGGIEVSGGLLVEHVNGTPCVPYHGSASAITQRIEAAVDPDIAKRRLNAAGKLKNIEGEPNYMFASNAVHSIVDNFWEAERLARVALADQRARSISDLRNLIRDHGYVNHRTVSSDARYIAAAHRNGNGV